MRLVTRLLTLSALACCLISTASADTLCIKKRQKVKNGKIVVTKNVVIRVEGDCPRRYVPFSNIEEFDINASSISGSQILPGSIDTAAIKDEAVTYEKLAPDAVYTNTIVIGANGTPQQNCQALVAAANSITDSSESKRYLIALEAGLYSCGATAVVLPSYVGIQGAGPNLTTIEGTAYSGVKGQLRLNSYNEVRDLTVINNTDSYSTVAIGMESNSGGNLRLSNVVAKGLKPEASTEGQSIGISLYHYCTGLPECETQMDNVIAEGFGNINTISGILFVGTTAKFHLSNVRASAKSNVANYGSGAMLNQCGEVHARNSVFEGDYRSVRITSPCHGYIAHSQLKGGTTGGGSNYHCYGTYDENMVGLSSQCNDY